MSRELPTADPASSRAAEIVAWGLLALVVPTAFWAARDQWFFLDEWEFLAGRSLADPGSLLASHNEHWTTVPIVLYQLIFRVVGLRHYWPYLVPVVIAHVAVAAQVRLLSLRTGAHAWAAVAALASIAFLGAGRHNFAWGFQVTMTGSLALGFGQLLLAPRAGPVGRRDVAAVALACAAATFSALGLVTAGATAVAMGLRGRWAAAAVHLAVPAGLVALWAIGYRTPVGWPPSTRYEEARFVLWTFVDSLEWTGGSAVVGVVLAALVVLGLLGPDWRPSMWLRGDGATAAALAAAAVAFTALTALNRAGIYQGRGVTPSRYVYVLAALLLPVAATGATCLMARIPDRPALRGAVVALLLVGLPYNLARLEATGVERFTLGSPEQVGAIVAAGDELGVPPDVEPQPHLMPGVTHGWLADQIADGLVLPRPGPDDPGLEAVRLAVALPTVDPATVPLASPAACTPLEPATPVRLDAGDVLVLDGTSATIRGEGGASMVLTPSSMAPTWTTWEAVAPLRINLVDVEPPGGAVRRCR